jgi:EmrB/QacA subfamily drug resistance transporter
MVDAPVPAAPGVSVAAPLSRRRIGWAFTGLMVGNAMAGLDATIVATAATSISGDLGRLDLRFWFFTAYQLAEVAVLPLYAKLGDLFGRRRIFAGAVLTFMVGSILCGSAQGIGWFIAARVLQGIGAGGLAGLSMALVADLVPAEHLGRYLGYAGLVFGVTSVLGPLAGGVFTDQWSWRWAFFVNIPFAIVGLVAVRFVPDHGSRRRHRLDLGGAALLVLSSTTAVLALNWGGREYAWTSPTILAMLAVSVASGVAFAWWQRRAIEPIIPPHVVRPRAVRASVTANLVAGIGFFVGIAYLPAFFESVAGHSATVSGLLLVPFALSVAAGTVLVGQVVERTGVGTKAFPMAGMASMAIGFALLGAADVDTPAGLVAAVAVLAGFGVGFVMQVLLHTVQTSVPPEDLGVGTAVTILARLLGGVVGVGVLGTVFNRALTSSILEQRPTFDVGHLPGDAAGVAALPGGLQAVVEQGFADAVHTTFWVAVPIALLGLVATCFLPTPSRPS